MKKICLLFFSAFVFLLLSACAPALHERLPVRAIGIDVSKNGFWVSVCAASPDQEGAELFYTACGESVPAALEKIEQETGKKAMFAHTAVLVYGRACAEKGIESSLDFWIRHYDSKPTIRLCVSDTTAHALLKPEKEDSTPGRVLARQLENSGQESGLYTVDMIDLIHRTRKMNTAVAVPVFEPGDPPRPSGTGVFRDLRLIGDLSEEAEYGYGILRGSFTGKVISLYTPGCGAAALRTDRNSAKIRFSGTKENPRFEIEIQIKGEISAISRGVQQPDRDALKELESAYEKEVLHCAVLFLTETVYTQRIDLLGLRRCAEEAMKEDMEFPDHAVFDIRVYAEIDRLEEENSPFY